MCLVGGLQTGSINNRFWQVVEEEGHQMIGQLFHGSLMIFGESLRYDTPVPPRNTSFFAPGKRGMEAGQSTRFFLPWRVPGDCPVLVSWNRREHDELI